MFWDQETKEFIDWTVEMVQTPTYRLLETVTDRIYKKTWHKLDANRKLKYIISNLPGKNTNWEYVKENNGAYFYWVTDKTLTLLQIQGARQTE